MQEDTANTLQENLQKIADFLNSQNIAPGTFVPDGEDIGFIPNGGAE